MQTSINPKGQPVAFAGLESDNGKGDVISAFSEEVSAAIPFGCGVVQATAPKGGKLPSGSGDVCKGVLSFSYAHAPGTFGDLGSTGIQQLGGRLRLKRQGRVWLFLDPSITVVTPYTDRGYLRYSANGGNTQVGAWSNVADVGHTIDHTAHVLFVSPAVTAADGTLIAEAELLFPAK